MAKTGAERQKEYEKRKIDAGFKRVPVWVPADKVEAWGRELGIAAPDMLVAGGSARTMNETVDDILFAFGLGLAALYMILASLFNSFTHPFTIMVSAPLSFIGGFLALKMAGMPLDMMSGIGLLVLSLLFRGLA